MSPFKGAEDQATGRSRGGLTIKIHMAVRGLGCPVRIVLTAGQKGDAPQADALIEALPANIVMADTAYGSDRLRKTISDKGALRVELRRKLNMLRATSEGAASGF